MRSRTFIAVLVAVVAVLLALLVWFRPDQAVEGEGEMGLTVAETLGAADTEGFARALSPRPFVFPADHGPHPEFRTEWWYFTGNLRSAKGRHFGYQLTFFRIALAPEAVPRSSVWATNQIFMAHFALTDVDGKRFHHFERFNRAALGLAGARAEPFHVWLENWSAEGLSSAALPPLRLRATAGETEIELELAGTKPVVLQGEEGLSRKSGEPGNASYYYSLTRLETVGRVRTGDEEFTVAGLSWLDREWSTSALAPDQVGWDWFSLQFDDGRELMYYQLRRKDGSVDPMSGGTLVEPDGTSRPVSFRDVAIEVLDTWESPRGGRYPARWRLTLPDGDLQVEIVPLLADQELRVTVRYWEGAVALHGTAAGTVVTGNGYVELTGYGDDPLRPR
jgi:predicted secreted hydrolase